MMPPIAQCLRFSLLAVGSCLPALLTACGGGPELSPEALNDSYRSALIETADRAGDFAPGSEEEAAALGRLQDYFDSMTEASVQTLTDEVYARDAYLNDTLAAVSGAEAIRRYFLHSAGAVEELSVTFTDTARSGPDYYVRWEMTIQSSKLNDGQPFVSLGVTHFRLDDQGRILIHKDFWDAATGLHEYLPGVGEISRRIRAGAAKAAMAGGTQ